MSMPTKFTEAMQDLIIYQVKQGVLLSTAAKVVGISRSTLHDWLSSSAAKFLPFQQRVASAQGLAQSAIEASMYRFDPKFWLLCGPGRERYDEQGNVIEGWSRSSPRPPQQANAARPTDRHELEAAILLAVAKHPEIRSKIANVLALIDEELATDASPVPSTPPIPTAPVDHAANGQAKDTHAEAKPDKAPIRAQPVRNGDLPTPGAVASEDARPNAAPNPTEPVRNGQNDLATNRIRGHLDDKPDARVDHPSEQRRPSMNGKAK